MALQSWGSFEKSENPEIFVNEIQGFLQKLSQIFKILKIVKKFFWLYSFSFDALDIIFGILQVSKILNTGKIFDFRFFDFFDDFGAFFEGRTTYKQINENFVIF